MPEGDTIWRTAATLRAGLEGKRVVRAQPDSLKRFAGRTVTEVRAVGKHLVIRFDNALAIHSHMRMRGAWHLYGRSEPWRRPSWQVRAVLETEDSVAVCFWAPVVEIVRDEASRLGHLGPDILDDDWSARDIVRRARSRGRMAIGELLLDQRVTAGIGNVYRCEALWQCRIDPWTPTEDLADDQLVALFEAAHGAMRANLRGDTRRRFPGYGRGAVHGRGGRPCPRCGTRISVRAQGELARMTFWCPTCQAKPVPRELGENGLVIRLTDDQVKVLNAPYLATVATVMPDGSPEATVVWIESDHEHIYFNTAMHRLKARNLQRDPRVAITAFDPENPNDRAVAVRGRAELIFEGAYEHANKLSLAYDGKPFRQLMPGEVRVIVRVTPERVHAQ